MSKYLVHFVKFNWFLFFHWIFAICFIKIKQSFSIYLSIYLTYISVLPSLFETSAPSGSEIRRSGNDKMVLSWKCFLVSGCKVSLDCVDWWGKITNHPCKFFSLPFKRYQLLWSTLDGTNSTTTTPG